MHWALHSERFALQRVSYHGNKRASAAELGRLANLTAGQNLLSLDVAATERAMAAHPWVRDVSIQRHFPHALSIRVRERVPAAMISLGDLYLVDDDGEPFKKLQPNDPVDLPLMTGLDRQDFLTDREGTQGKVRSALEVIAAYESSSLAHGEPLSEVRLTSEGLTLVAGPNAQEIRLGESAIADKLSRLAKVRTELARRGVQGQVIHLDNRSRPGWVAVKLAISASERSGGSSQ